MYKLREAHGVLATPWGVWHEDEPFVPNPDIPRDKLKAWLEQGVIVMDDEGPDVEEILEETDQLSNMSRQELLGVLVANKEQLGAIKPRKSWPDEAIRQAIRDMTTDLSTLKMPTAAETSSL